VRLATELRAAGLVKKADAMLSEVVHEQTGIRPIRALQAGLDDNLAKLRSTLGMRPRRQKSRNPRPTVQDRLIVLLAEAGVRECTAWKISKGYWLRKQADVMRWECLARRWGEQQSGVGFHVGSWSSMSDCVRYGITVADDEKHGGGYCTISVEAKYPQKRKL
jgi:hypothetical protein